MRSLRTRLLVLAALALGGAVTGSAAAAGELDTSFGNAGTSLIDLGGTEGASAVALRPDGAIVVAGTRGPATPNGPLGVEGIVAQITAAGGLDTSYGGGSGWSRLVVGAPGNAFDLALPPDGRIVVAGYAAFPAGPDVVVSRLTTPGGTFDPTFAGGGWAKLDFGGGADSGSAVALTPAGEVLIGGDSASGTGSDGLVARLRPGGVLDPAYGGGFGWSRLDFGGYDDVRAIVVRPDGRIVTAGNRTGAGQVSMAVAQLTSPGGTFDPAFGGGDGRAFISSGTVAVAKDLLLQPDGRIVVVGNSNAGGEGDALVARLLPDGAPDASFSGDGVATVDLGGPDGAEAVALQADGKIVIAGSRSGTAQTDAAVARLHPSGALDSTFGDGGISVVDFGGAVDNVADLALRRDGRVVVVGAINTTTRADIAVAQLRGDAVAAAAGPLRPSGPGTAGRPPRCAGRPATIVGSAGPELLRGTPGPDVIVALGGADVVRAGGGADIVCGGTGPDRLAGGPGADSLLGGPGADRLAGGTGRDRLTGGPGRDVLLGGPGRDAVRR